MFNNPLRKYQQGGTAPTQEQQKLLAAFIEWLPKRVKEFQGMAPEAIAQALDGMSKTPEGQKQVQQLMQQFQQEMQQSSAPAFRNGGKIHDFICKHAKGGIVDCGCGGFKVPIAQEGSGEIFDSGVKLYNENGVSLDDADLAAIERRRQPRTITYVQNKTPWNRNWNNFNGYWSKKPMLPERNVVIGREALGVNPLNDRYETMGFTTSSEEFKYQDGGEIQYSESNNPDVQLTRRQARLLSKQNKGFDRSQFQLAMANANNALRNAGLRGKELRNQKRILVSGISGQDRNLVEQPITVVLNSNEPATLNAPAELTGVPERVVVKKQVVSEPIATRADYPLQVNIPTVSGSLPERVGRRSGNRTRSQSDRDRNMGRVEQYMRLTGADETVSEWNSDQLAKDYAAAHGITLNEVPINRESEEYAEGVRQANREAAITTGVGMVAAPTVAWAATTGIPAAFNYGREVLSRAITRNAAKNAIPRAETVMRNLNFGRGPIVDGRSIYYVSGPGAFLKKGGKFKK